MPLKIGKRIYVSGGVSIGSSSFTSLSSLYNFYYDGASIDAVSGTAHSSYAWPYSSCPKLSLALEGTDSDATGQIVVEWVPEDDGPTPAAQVSVDLVDLDSTGLISYDHSTETIVCTDGTNSISVDCTPVDGTLVEITINYDAYGMSLEVR